MLNIENLNFSYKKGKQILYDISLNIKPGEIVGLIGMNGAGKSTLMRNISGIVNPDSGKIVINGTDRKKYTSEERKKIAYLNAENNLYNEITVKENINIMQHFYNVSKVRTENVIKMLRCDEFMDKKVSELSSGMRQRAAIAASTLNNSNLILLDEPTNAIDIETKKYIMDYINYLSNKKNGILITSHNIKDIEELCERVYIMRHGRIVKEATVESILKESSEKNQKWSISVPKNTDIPRLIGNNVEYYIEEGDLNLKVVVNEKFKQSTIKLFVNSDVEIISVESFINNLEDAVLEIIGD
ncbi:MAG: ABC transporter ATP-binding protein [Oscillospiraceae bacterium]|nr:ABC transporter ATP-binding protein [Oscillospiraceae bacterium]